MLPFVDLESCTLSLWLFNVFMDRVTREAKGSFGVK